MTPEARDQQPLHLLFIRHRDLLAAADDPVAALRAYLVELAAAEVGDGSLSPLFTRSIPHLAQRVH